MRAKFFIFLIPGFIVFSTAFLRAGQQSFLNGYQETISGEVISYHAPDPRAKTALLVRSLDSTRSIRWRTAPVPENFAQSTVSFVWLFGMDASADQQEFTLRADGREMIRFGNPVQAELHEVEFRGKEGSSLVFRTTLVDRHKDMMGYAVLTLPSSAISPGKPVDLQINGSTSGSSIWYMTFQLPVEESISISPQQLLMERDGKNYQALLVEFVNLGREGKISISGENLPAEDFKVSPGYNACQYLIPEVRAESTVLLSFSLEDEPEDIQRTCRVKPVRPWTIYLVQHTHTDIGYTRTQSEILPEHLRFIDYALDFCDQTDDYPEDARFRWTCESAWAVDEYLRRRPEKQIDRLLRRIKEGRIEVTAMPFNLSEIADEPALKYMLRPVKHFKDRGIPVTTAMQDDVNGIAWCLADYLPGMGVKYLIMGEHGHRALIPFDQPTVFWWQSPSGNKVLAYRAEHYMYGNFLLLHTGEIRGFSDNLLRYLEDLEEKNYPFDQISLQYSGYVTDNSPPALGPNRLIKEWNERYIWPKLRSATAGEFLNHIEKNYGEDLQEIRKAWPDWWTDGFGSAARETAAAREAQSEMNTTTGLFTMAALSGTPVRGDVTRRIQNIYDQILFYDEHTFGAAESISDPSSRNSMEQWAEKSSYAWDALKQSRVLREEALGLIQEHLPRYDEPSLTVFNTLNWARSGPVSIYIDHEILEPGHSFSILDPGGREIPAQALESRSDGTTWVLWVNDIPALGYRTYRIRRGSGTREKIEKIAFTGEFSNAYYTLALDPQTGGFSSLKFNGQGRELVDEEAGWKTGQLIYERLTDRHQLEQFTLNEEPLRKGMGEIVFQELVEGPVWSSIHLSGKIPDCAQDEIKVEYRFYREHPLIELVYTMDKKPVQEPESVYIAFPLHAEDGRILFDVPGGVVAPGTDQIPGTSSDWNTVQNFVAVVNQDYQWLISSPEIPLFHLGGLNLGKFSYFHEPDATHVYSWVMNNYWTTNFRASQEGEFTWRYFMDLADDPGISAATRFGWQSQVPLVARVLPPGENPGKPESLSMLKHELPGLLLVNSTPGGTENSVVLHFRETAGTKFQLDPGKLIRLESGISWQEVNVLGIPLTPENEQIIFEPYSVHLIEIRWAQ